MRGTLLRFVLLAVVACGAKSPTGSDGGSDMATSDMPAPSGDDLAGSGAANDLAGADFAGVTPDDLTPTCAPDPINCPQPPYASGGACPQGFGECSFTPRCGKERFTCCAGTWQEVNTPPACSACPSAAPTIGAPCTADLQCEYATANYCTFDSFYCRNGSWAKLFSSTCAMPPCPSSPPTNGMAGCTDGQKCSWASSCHSEASATCAGGQWTVSIPCP